MGAGSVFRYDAILSIGSACAFLHFRDGTEAGFVTVYSTREDRDMKVHILFPHRD
jgi:hypothetical protein